MSTLGREADARDQHDGAFKNKLAEACKLSQVDYLQQRKALSEKLGIPCSLLDEERKRQQKQAKPSVATMQAHWKVDPWVDPIKPHALFLRVRRRIKRHVVMSDHAANSAALWVMFAWAHETAVHSPILLVSSPEAECGKSTLLGLITYLVPRGLSIVEATGSVIYRMVEKWHPTLIVDEADEIFKNSHELRGIINSGWTRGTGVPRCHPETHEPEFFETFGPKAIGLKGLNVPDTTLGRSIIIDLQRKLPTDQAENFAHLDDDDLAQTRQQLARFAADYTEELRDCSPEMPEGFANRIAANWRLLLAIAELCGIGPNSA
jgi:putative DNA primase/helicase